MRKNKYSKDYIQLPGNTLPKELVKIIKTEKNAKVIDVGCGDGVTIESLIKGDILSKNNIFGIDIDLRRVKESIKRNKGVEFFFGDLKDLPRSRGKFDILYSLMVIEHVENDYDFLKTTIKVLKPSGWIFISTILKKKWAWYFYKNSNGKTVLDPTHVREYFFVNDILPKFKKVGFRNLNYSKVPFKVSLIELCFKAMIRVNILKTNHVRSLFDNSVFLNLIRRRVEVIIPGYYEVDIWGQK
jgi:2-polyprenyl-3-methyl-5-hydroxy-6-metoxy-1,4-benzoquinol methylase